MCVHAKSLQSCSALHDPMDSSPPGSSVHGTLQARVLEWLAMPSSKGSSQTRDPTHVSSVSRIGRWALYPCRPLGSLWYPLGPCNPQPLPLHSISWEPPDYTVFSPALSCTTSCLCVPIRDLATSTHYPATSKQNKACHKADHQ